MTLWGLTLAALLVATPTEPTDTREVVASWDGGTATRAEYDDWLQLNNLKDSSDSLKEFVFVESFADIARKRGVETDPSVRLRMQLERNKLLSAALQKHLKESVKISDDELEALRREQPDAFKRPRKLKLLNIYQHLDADPEASQKARQRMKDVRTQLLAGADFAELAATESESQTRFRGGQLGYVDPEKLPPAVAKAVRTLKVGEISEIVEARDALMLFRCEDVKEAVTPSAEEVRTKLRNNLWRIRSEEGWKALQDRLWQAADPKIKPRSSGQVIEMQDYQLEAADLAALVQQTMHGKALADVNDNRLASMLHDWAVSVLLAREAVRLQLDQDPGLALKLRWLPVQALARNELSRRIDEQLVEPGEAELREAWAQSKGRYTHPAEVDLAVIYFGEMSSKTAAKEDRARVAEAEAVERQVSRGELAFDEAAKRYSKHPSAASGGELGFISTRAVSQWGPAASQAVRGLQPGQRSGLLRLQSGLWILELRGRRPKREMSYDEALPQVRQQLRKVRIHELEAKVREQHWGQIHMTFPAANAEAVAP
ncbi:MAG: peptidylprolyl isomerase [Chitinophagaceae bacterium]